MTLVAVALGGALGAVLRVVLAARVGGGRVTPTGIAVVNLVGAFAVGVLVGLDLPARGVPDAVVVGLGAGLLGALTTYSTWGLDVVTLWQRGTRAVAVALAVGLLGAGLLLAWGGLALGGRVPVS